MENKNMTVCK